MKFVNIHTATNECLLIEISKVTIIYGRTYNGYPIEMLNGTKIYLRDASELMRLKRIIISNGGSFDE